MAMVTAQYLSYVEEIRERNLELAAEYLLMASMLIDIKSRTLLPPTRAPHDTDEIEDPRAALVARLLAYEQIKLAAQQIGQLPLKGRDFWCPQLLFSPSPVEQLPIVSVNDLAKAWAQMGQRSQVRQSHTVAVQLLSVRETMSHVLRRLQTDAFLEWGALFEHPCPLPVLIVTFLAILELAKDNLVELSQVQAYDCLYVRHLGNQANLAHHSLSL
jgi:segregation and condensation protein A